MYVATIAIHTYSNTNSLTASGAWTSKGIVYTSGTVPSLNGTIVPGGIKAQTVCPNDSPDSFFYAFNSHQASQ